MSYLGRGPQGSLVNQPGQVNLFVSIPTQATFGSLTVLSGALLPAFDSLVVKTSGVSTLGLVTQGSWQGSGITQDYGGTGQTSYVQGDILYVDGAGGLTVLPSGDEGQVLTIFNGAITWV